MAGLKHSAGLEVLVEALDDNELRFRAVSALAELGDKEALPALRKLFARWILPAFDRTQAAAALVKLGDVSARASVQARRPEVERRSRDGHRAARRSQSARRARAARADPEDPGGHCAGRRRPRARPARRCWPRCRVLEAVLGEKDASDDLKLDVAEGLWLLPEGKGRELLEGITLSSPEARAELAALLSEGPLS